MKKIKEIFWEYKKIPDKKSIEYLQRIAQFFPLYGRDKETIYELHKNLNILNIPQEKKKLIKVYYDLLKRGELG